MVLSICRVITRHAARMGAGAGDRLVVRGQGVEHLVVDAAVDQGEGEPVGREPVGVAAGDPFDQAGWHSGGVPVAGVGPGAQDLDGPVQVAALGQQSGQPTGGGPLLPPRFVPE